MTTRVEEVPATADDLGRGSHTFGQRVHELLHRQPALSPAVVLLLAIIVFSLLSDRFIRPQNLSLVLQQVSIVGSLAVGVGWLTSCVAALALRRPREPGRFAAAAGALVASSVVAIKIVPGVPGSFTAAEWIAFGLWSALGLTFWIARRRSR